MPERDTIAVAATAAGRGILHTLMVPVLSTGEPIEIFALTISQCVFDGVGGFGKQLLLKVFYGKHIYAYM